jgi:hypothetical protein
VDWLVTRLADPLLIGLVEAFDELASFECRAGSDEGDQVWCVDGAPARLGGLDELEGHGHAAGAGTGSFSGSLPQPREVEPVHPYVHVVGADPDR